MTDNADSREHLRYSPPPPYNANTYLIIGSRKISVWSIAKRISASTIYTPKQAYALVRLFINKKLGNTKYGKVSEIKKELGLKPKSNYLSAMLSNATPSQCPSSFDVRKLSSEHDFKSRRYSKIYQCIGTLMTLQLMDYINAADIEKCKNKTFTTLANIVPELKAISQGDFELVVEQPGGDHEQIDKNRL